MRAARVRTRFRLLLAAAIVALATTGTAGCGGGEHRGQASRGAPPEPGRAHANRHVAAPGAKVRIVSPIRGESVGQRVEVKVEVSGFHLSARGLDRAPKQGWGHLHFRLDGGRYDRRPYSGRGASLAARLGVTGRFTPAVRPALTYDRLPAGRHRLVVSLANNDLSETGVRARTVFRVR